MTRTPKSKLVRKPKPLDWRERIARFVTSNGHLRLTRAEMLARMKKRIAPPSRNT